MIPNQNQLVPQQQPQNDIATNVRHYIHYSNLASNYMKQSNEARKLKNIYEDKTIQTLRANNMDNAILRITDGTLQIAEESNPPCLSMPRIRSWLNMYYKQKGNGVNETEQILRFFDLQKKQETKTTAYLKKTPLPAALPPPAQAPGSLK
jgi:pyruvate-formate lyase